MELNRDNKGALFFELFQVVADHLWSLNSLYNTGELGPDQPTAIYIQPKYKYWLFVHCISCVIITVLSEKMKK